jgi:23S rRNA (guanosine2251-2'-O)-methyltransferase
MIQLEGVNLVEQGVRKGRVTIVRVERGREENPKVKSILDMANRGGVKKEFVSRAVLDRMSLTGHHQGIIAIAQPNPQWSLQQILKETGSEVCILLMDQVQDPHNLGAILRTCDGAGVDGVVIPKKGAVSATSVVHRVSMGASLSIPLLQQSLYSTIKMLKDEGLKVVGLDISGQADYFDIDLTGPMAFVVGGEDRGINPTLLGKCDNVVRLPMRGQIKSLNLSVATSVLLYERLRQQENKWKSIASQKH